MAATVAEISQEQRHDLEWFELVKEVRSKAKRFEQAVRRGDQPAADLIQAELQHLSELVAYALRKWKRGGGWNRYYRVRGGVVHTNMSCRTIGLHTVIELLTELSAKPLADVAKQHKMCRHCGHRETIHAQGRITGGMKRHYMPIFRGLS